MIYCFKCDEYFDCCATDDVILLCPACYSSLIIVLGEVPVNRIERIIEKLEVVWYDHSDMSLGEILEDMFGLPFSDIPDNEIEKSLDEYIKTF